MKFIDGGICAAKGFSAAGMHCGVKSKNPDKKDVALIYSECVCSASAVYTKNIVKAAPLLITREHLKNGRAQAVIANSGIANACAANGEANAERMCAAAARALGISSDDVVAASTGVIGQELNIAAIEDNVDAVAASLRADAEGSDSAASAIMTTDTVKKELAVEATVGGKPVRLGGIAKGSGMIHPNMGTMLCFLTTDCKISPDMIRRALLETVNVSFNRISVDGDTSTNDMCVLLANGLAGNDEIVSDGAAYEEFVSALKELCINISRRMASDGEGAKHLITCTVSGASSEKSAETMAKSVISSTLTKAAIFGADANWGRVLCAMGYSGETFDPDGVDIKFVSAAGELAVCEKGRGLVFDEALAKKILTEHDILIDIKMSEGSETCTAWGCDITYDYIKINGDYRT